MSVTYLFKSRCWNFLKLKPLLWTYLLIALLHRFLSFRPGKKLKRQRKKLTTLFKSGNAMRMTKVWRKCTNNKKSRSRNKLSTKIFRKERKLSIQYKKLRHRRLRLTLKRLNLLNKNDSSTKKWLECKKMPKSQRHKQWSRWSGARRRSS